MDDARVPRLPARADDALRRARRGRPRRARRNGDAPGRRPGCSGVVYCGSMGDWPLLSDEQRRTGVERLVAAGVPVVVGTGAQSPARAAALAAHAASVGAAGLMVIPRVLSRGVRQPPSTPTSKACSPPRPSLPA